MKTAKKNGAVTKKKKAPAKPKKMGRPTKFTVKLGETICARMCAGESLREICRDEKMPNRSSVHLWLIQAKGEKPALGLANFSDQYGQANEVRAENMFDELTAIADDGENDYMTKIGRDGEEFEVVNSEHIQRSRLRADVRKWMLSKMLKKYGDKNVHVTEDSEGNQMPISGNAVTFATQTANEITTDEDS